MCLFYIQYTKYIVYVMIIFINSSVIDTKAYCSWHFLHMSSIFIIIIADEYCQSKKVGDATYSFNKTEDTSFQTALIHVFIHGTYLPALYIFVTSTELLTYLKILKKKKPYFYLSEMRKVIFCTVLCQGMFWWLGLRLQVKWCFVCFL